MAMRVLIVNTSERTGGAAVAAGRLMDALNNNGVKAKMLVRDKETDSFLVSDTGCSRLRKSIDFLWERVRIWLANGLSRKNLFKVSIANTGKDITKLREFQEADVIHLHWINQGMLSLNDIKKILHSGKPLVWTMHDMWECTGICHYSWDCQRYEECCGNCPQLRFPKDRDLSYKVFQRKLHILDHQNVHFVAVSSWLADCARKSLLTCSHPIEVIPNVLSLSKFSMNDRVDCRTYFGIQEDYVIAFGAARIDDPIKGLDNLKKALALLVNAHGYQKDQVRLLIFGRVKDATVLEDMPVKTTFLNFISDERELSKVYSAANCAVSSSHYETFGQTLIEALACGCIPVSFDNSGQRDIIEHLTTGYLAKGQSVDDLAKGIDWAFHAQISRASLRNQVLRKYSGSDVANRYIHLYNQISKVKA